MGKRGKVKKYKERRRRRKEKGEESELLDRVQQWIVPDLAAIIVRYAVKDIYHLEPVPNHPSLFLPTLSYDDHLLDGWFDKLRELGTNATVHQLRHVEENYQRVIRKMPDNKEVPRSLLSTGWIRYERMCEGMVWKTLYDFSIIFWFLLFAEDTPESTQRLCEIVNYMIGLNSRFANICYREVKCHYLQCDPYEYMTPLSLAMKRQHGEPLVQLLKQHGAQEGM